MSKNINKVSAAGLVIALGIIYGDIGTSPLYVLNEIINGKRGISPDFALVLETVLGTTAEMWVRMQADYDLWKARKAA